MSIFGRRASCLLVWTIAVMATPAQDTRAAETRAAEDSRAKLASADEAFAAAEEADQSGRPGLFVRTAYGDAETAYQKAAEAAVDPLVRGKALLGVGWSAVRSGRFDDGLTAFAAAEKIPATADDAAFAAARALLEVGRRDDARDMLSRYLLDAASPLRGDAVLLVLASRLDSGDRAAIAALMKDVLPTLPFAVRTSAWDLLARRLRDLPGDAFYASLLSAAATSTPNDPAAIFWQGDLYLARGRYPEALAQFRRFRTLLPSDPAGRLWTGVAEVRNGLTDAARASIDDAAAAGAAEESVESAYRELVYAHFLAKRWDEALQVQALVCGRTDGIQDRLDLANLYKDAGRYDEASATYDALIAREDLRGDRRAKACNDRALLERARGRLDAAESFFRASIAAFDDERDARENLGILLLETGRQDEGRKLLEWCVARENGRVRSRYFLFRADHPIVDGAVSR